jgi:small ubiquitin-related modifier
VHAWCVHVSCRPVPVQVPSECRANNPTSFYDCPLTLTRSLFVCIGYTCTYISMTHYNILQGGEETFFKIKKTTKMQKVFSTYAERKGVQATSLRFLLDGEAIKPDSTPKMLELEDQDQIDCLLEQTGGGRCGDY